MSMNIDVQVTTSSPDEVDLIKRYWATNGGDKYLEPVSALLPFREIKQSNALARFVRERCAARDLNQICPICKESPVIFSRAEAKKQLQQHCPTCHACQNKIDAEAQEKKEAEMAKLRLRLKERQDQLDNNAIDYTGLTDDIALLLLALDRAIKPKLTTGTFLKIECGRLAPSPYELFQKLVDAGVIVDDPDSTFTKAYRFVDDELCINAAIASYKLVRDSRSDSNDSTIHKLSQRPFEDRIAIYNLWLDYATGDCLHYLNNQCSRYQLPFDAASTSIESVIRSALEQFSVSQIWFMTYVAAKEVSSLSTMQFWNLHKAAQTLPNKLFKIIERARKEQKTILEWDRLQHIPAGTLGQLFYEFYGIDEYTSGAALKEFFLESLPNKSAAMGVSDSATHLLEIAISNRSSLQILETFAEFIISGESVPDSISLTISKQTTSNDGD